MSDTSIQSMGGKARAAALAPEPAKQQTLVGPVALVHLTPNEIHEMWDRRPILVFAPNQKYPNRIMPTPSGNWEITKFNRKSRRLGVHYIRYTLQDALSLAFS